MTAFDFYNPLFLNNTFTILNITSLSLFMERESEALFHELDKFYILFRTTVLHVFVSVSIMSMWRRM